jgi:hypothetical protein
VSQFLPSNILPILLWTASIVGLLIVFSLLVFVIRKLFGLLLVYRSKRVALRITPPAFDDKNLIATESLFSAMHALGSSRTFKEKLLGRNYIFSAEIHSSKQTGIQFYVITESSKAASLEKLITAYVPDAKVSIEDVVPEAPISKILSFKQSKSYVYPLKEQEYLDMHDPLSYVTNAMTKLKENERIMLQLVIKPVRLKSTEMIRNRILRNDAFMPESKSKKFIFSPLVQLVNSLLFWVADAASMTYDHQSRSHQSVASARKDLQYKEQIARGDKPVRTLSYFEHEVVESVSEKLKRPLFATDIRIAFKVNKKEIKDLRGSMQAALGLFDVPSYQSLKLHRRIQPLVLKLVQICTEKRMLYPAYKPNYFSSNELAGLYHFPHSLSGKTDNVVKSLSKTLSAPLSLKDGRKLDIMVGVNKHHGTETQIGLSSNERERHMYVIGGTGNGKTTLLKYQIVQDILEGRGLAVVDPHGDLAEEILGYIPPERIKDVIYINPDDLSRPVGINLLELPKDLTGDDLLREKDLVTESTVSVLRKIFSEDDNGGHRIEYVLRNTIQTALTMESANMFTIFRLLNDAKYRKGVVNRLEDEDLKIFWKNELGKAGEMQRVKMAAGITAKIGRFLFSASARRMLEQDVSTVNFDTAMDEKKIIICNFSKGLLGEDTSMLFGVTILAKLQLAALRRARVIQAKRVPYYLYVDEFQNFATMSFVQMLSEARKYKLFLIMAEQSTQQQADQRLVDIVLANVGTVITFRTGSPADERLILPLFKPYVSEGELSHLPAYTFYCRISAIEAQEPMSGETVLLDTKPDISVAETVKQTSREVYGFTKLVESVVEEMEDIPEKKQKARKYKRSKSGSITEMQSIG